VLDIDPRGPGPSGTSTHLKRLLPGAHYETPPYNGGNVARFYLGGTENEGVVLGVNPELGRSERHEYRWLAVADARRLLVLRLEAVLNWAEQRLAACQDTGGTDTVP
jgi:hypothetical protein